MCPETGRKGKNLEVLWRGKPKLSSIKFNAIFIRCLLIFKLEINYLFHSDEIIEGLGKTCNKV